MTPRRRPAKRKVAKKKTPKPTDVLSKIDYWAIAANEVYEACKRAGMSNSNALGFAMDRASYPDWIVDIKDPIRKPWDDDEDDD